MPTHRPLQEKLTLIYANVRGLQTNIGDLAHSFIIPHNLDIIVTVETFLNPTIPANFGHIQGYSRWLRRDCAHGTFGGIAVCFREGLAVEALEVEMDRHLEMMFFRLWTSRHETILLCVCYRPQWQGKDPIHFLHSNIDTLPLQHNCNHLIVVGDMNQRLVARQFENLLTEYGLNNHVNFPTHISGSSLDPFITDLPEEVITCLPLGMVGSSDHSAVLTTISTTVVRDEATARVNWLWSRGDWDSLKENLDSIVWTEHLHGDCRRAADNKSTAWLRYKSHPSQLNKNRHKEACKTMCQVQKQAIQRWREDLKAKFSGQSVSSKEWWCGVKQQQGLFADNTIPPLTRPNGQDIINLPAPDIRVEGRSLPLQRSISILGVEFDAGLTFTRHARRVAKNSAWRLSCVRRISHLLDAKGVEFLYKAQVRPLMEYSFLAWSSCPPSYLATLDRVQRRAQRLVSDKRPHHAPDSFQPLQKRRDVGRFMCHAQGTKSPHAPPDSHQAPQAPAAPSLHPCRPTQTGASDCALLQDRVPRTFLLTPLRPSVEPVSSLN
ncbi:hypothetical protein GWK47_049766 [Chionoecetes opilio]|uniref:Endonuclease/exonuclease/phosphatase domain-containing protein n=1 Tax=Chionoecetes opilio TaxID=41210 RepID=A0A8J4Y3S9_CHIOP|nr:hypothetical protein GWK47_049766 [Chionoecetes opilio]